MIKETMAYLSQYDPEVGATIENEYHREQRNIELIASENIASPSTPTSSPTPARARTSRPSRRCSSPATPTWA